MTGLIVQPRRVSIASPPGIAWELEPAFSTETKDLTRLVDALRPSTPTPTSFARQILPEKALAERLFDALSRVKTLTATVAMHLDATWRGSLFSQLDTLHDPAEWDPDDEPVKVSSFATFLKAIVQIRPDRRPGLGLSQAGHLIAAWTTGRDRLTIEFLPNDHVRWVLSRYYDDEPVRIAGQMAVSRLVEQLEPHEPAHWFSRENKRDLPAG